ncbi:MAG: PspC domain-containing protein [Lachnospiraceae bacterium]|nr:PspC domain-containing protein [Lachnospiraceae bacterium]
MEKRLYKTRYGNLIDGVCGGIAQYFNVDPTIIRLLWIAFCVAGGSGILAYFICAIVIPREPRN